MSSLSGRQLALGALTGAGRYAIGALVALAVTPYALHQLGPAQFGVWALAGAVLGMLHLIDLGFVRALTYRVATALGQRRPDAARAALATGRSLALGLGALMFTAVALASRPLVERVLDVPATLQAEAVTVIAGTALVAALEVAFAPFQAALDGADRLDLTNTVDTVVQRLLSPLGVVLVLGLGWGLTGLVLKNLAAALVAGAAYAWLLGRHTPELAGSTPRLDRGEAGALFAFGRHVHAVALASALVEPVSKTLVTRVVGLDALALYELAARVTGQLGGVFMALSTALFPAAARLRAAAWRSDGPRAGGLADGELAGDELAGAGGEHDGPGSGAGGVALLALYRVAARYNAWAVLPVYALFLGLADPFVVAWLGPAYRPLAPLLQILGTGWCVALLALPAFLVAQAGGAPRISTVGGLVTAAVSLGAAAALVRPAGLHGVVLGLALGLAAGGVVTLALFARAFGTGWSVLAMFRMRVLLAALLGTAAARAIAGTLPAGLLPLGVAGLAGLLLAAALMLVSGEVDAADRARIRRLVSGSGGNLVDRVDRVDSVDGVDQVDGVD